MIHWIDVFQACVGRERFGGFGCYDVILEPGGITWPDAYDRCADMNKTLLAIESAEENDAVENYLLQNEGTYAHFSWKILDPWAVVTSITGHPIHLR